MTVFKRKNRGIYYYKIRLAANQWRTCAGYTDKRAMETSPATGGRGTGLPRRQIKSARKTEFGSRKQSHCG